MAGAVIERLGKEFPAAPGSGVTAGAGELRLLLKSGNVLVARVVAAGEEGRAAGAGKQKRGKGRGGCAAEEEGGAGGGGGGIQYDVVLP